MKSKEDVILELYYWVLECSLLVIVGILGSIKDVREGRLEEREYGWANGKEWHIEGVGDGKKRKKGSQRVD